MRFLATIHLLAGLLLVTVFPSIAIADLRKDPVLDYKPVIETVITSVIIPGYEELLSAADIQFTAVDQLCLSPSNETLLEAQLQFKALTSRWSAVEMFRFGPARSQNRFERLFFWPDRRSRGIKQVQKILSNQDKSILNIDTLQKKSVAVQGILSLEYLLFGTGFQALSSNGKNSFRCQYAKSVSAAIRQTSNDILLDWRAEDGFSKIMKTAGTENSVFKTNKEVIRDILQYSSELLQSIIALKLAPSLQDSQEEAKAKRAPFWRSGVTLAALDANLVSILTLQNIGKLYRLLPIEDRGNAIQLQFEIDQVRNILRLYKAPPYKWQDILHSPEGYEKLKYIQIPLSGANDILAEYYPQILGISMGFNSLDGD